MCVCVCVCVCVCFLCVWAGRSQEITSITSAQIQSATESGDRFKINDRELSQVQWNLSYLNTSGLNEISSVQITEFVRISESMRCSHLRGYSV